MESDNDLIATITPLIMDAGYSVDLKTDWKYGHEWGIPLQDIGAIVDSRLRLRCLLPLPYPEDVTASLNPIDNLAKLMKELQEYGWEARIADSGGRLVTFLIIDDEHVIFREKLNVPVPFQYSDKFKDIMHYKAQFDRYWETALDMSEFEIIYRSRIIANPEDTKPLIVFSSDTWSRLIRSFATHPEDLLSMPPRQFEELIAELLTREGMSVTLTPATRDGGRDILALARTPIGQQLYLAECKRHGKDNPVDVSVVRSLYGVVMQENASAGLIVTTSRFTSDAVKFAEPIQYRMGLRDFGSLVDWLKKYTR
jgi:HJR/Mrr/RecB family endonuclease